MQIKLRCRAFIRHLTNRWRKLTDFVKLGLSQINLLTQNNNEMFVSYHKCVNLQQIYRKPNICYNKHQVRAR